MSDSRAALISILFSNSHQALRRYVQRLIKSPETAEDIVQEAFLRTYERGDRVQTPRVFLFSDARNLASDARRHYRVQKTDSLGDIDASHVLSTSESPESEALAEERSRLLKEAVDRLSPQCRAAFMLRVFHAYSYNEIAQRLLNLREAEREASEWIARLNADDVSADDRARFEAWRSAHPLHARSYQELSDTW